MKREAAEKEREFNNNLFENESEFNDKLSKKE